MSVLIKGFPLPNNCGACPLRLAWCRERIYMVTRPERCPLVPVPPHGRLIDGGVAEGIYFTEEDENGKDFCDGILYAADWISKQPTIIPPSGGKKDE